MDDPKFCRAVLAAACLAYRPLSLPELHVLAGLPPRVPSSTIAEKCGSFLAINDGTVQMLHNSTKEFVQVYLESRLQEGGAGQVHVDMGKRSIDAMSDILGSNIYNLHPGSQSSDITVPKDDRLAPVRYSCEFWADHLCKVDGQNPELRVQLSDNGAIFAFLKEHLLHWFEALSLNRKISDGVLSIRKLLYAAQVR